MQFTDIQQQTPPRRSYHLFDSLAYAKSMESVGFTRQQAEKMAEEQAKLIDERLATKEDTAVINSNIEALRLSTSKDIEVLRLATKADIETTKAEILKWMFGQTIVIIAAIVGILRVGIH
jgi:hypothetical protein